MEIEVKESEKFGWKGVKGWNIDIFKKSSVSYIEIGTKIPPRKNSKNDRIYFVIKGKVIFNKGNKKYVVNEKKAIFIPKNIKYSFLPETKTKLIEVNIPPFSLKDETIYK